MPSFTTLDAVVLVGYLLGVTAFGLALSGRQRDADDYFLAGHAVPWWAIAFSTVATETSALTVISVPATVYTGDFWILQLALGYLIGRIGVALFLLPVHFAGEGTTAYEFLGRRFGAGTRRFASAIFLVTRALADSVRVFAASIPVALLTGLPYWQAIGILGVATLVYTYFGGLKAVVWVDVVQLTLYMVGGGVAIALLATEPGGWGGILERVPADKFRIFHFEGGFDDATWVVTGIVGGAVLSLASHGIDHLVVQRLLAAHDLAAARKALIADAALVLVQFAIFLVIGAGLFAYFDGRPFPTPDEVYPTFIIERFPPGLSGLVIAAILAAAMSTLSSSLNALSSSSTLDIYGPLKGERDPVRLMKVGRALTLFWAVALIGGAILFRFVSQGTPVVVIALQIASFTYGGLLGGFLLGILFESPDERDAVTGIAVTLVAMTALWAVQQFGVIEPVVDTLWFSLIGSVLTIGVGLGSSRLRRAGPARGGAPDATA